ncbi:MAG: Maf family protein, partial [Wenzhouxiangellaceae bacterium]
VAASEPDALVIGGDQVAALGDQVLGKPGDRAGAITQLQQMSGRKVVYLSGLALLGPGVDRIDIVPTTLQFRTLNRAEIERYVDIDKPFDCAGAMRSESGGITLLRALTSEDPSALIGLPLIRLAEWLRQAGFSIP